MSLRYLSGALNVIARVLTGERRREVWQQKRECNNGSKRLE